MEKLSDFAKKQSPFLIIADGESVEGIFESYEIVPSTFDPSRRVVQYTLIVNDEKKFFKSSAGGVAMAFEKAGEGAIVKITRSGEGRETRYKVEVVGPEIVEEKGKK